MQKVIRVMSFAKQRFDSCGTPQRQFCCMVVAIAMMLAYVVSDSRKKAEVRARARKRKFADPTLYDSTFPTQVTVKDDEEEAEVDDNDESREVGGSEYMEKLQGTLPKAGPLLATVCKKCYDGTYDELYKNFAAEEPSVLAEALQTQSNSRGAFGKDLDDLLKALNTAQAVVETSGGSAPTLCLRDLLRQKSDPLAAEDVSSQRDEVWKKTVAQRRKLIRLRLVKGNAKTVAAYAESFRNAGETQDWKPKAKNEHRVFVMSADLMNDAGDAPWTTKAPPR